MTLINKKSFILSVLLIVCNFKSAYPGPPFDTDDPETVNFKHWEYYISSINTYQIGLWSGTSPHLEVNYGLIPNVQVHLLLPMNYLNPVHRHADFGYADTEFGIKFRFVSESDNSPQIGTFPILEIPTIKNSEFSSGKLKIYLPIWLQKSWGRLTTYGGAGYWINPGTVNKNWIFAGWELQYDFAKSLTLGGEIFFHSASAEGLKSVAGFNIGGSVNPSEKFHIIFSFGQTVTHDNTFNSYLGLLWTL
jgi:hypothetical protein